MNQHHHPIVSVVIPMYNVEKFIDISLSSVLKQTFRQFEVICVDDGCTDNTVDKVKQYQDARIRIVQQENRGLSGARNTGIQAARGIYVALLDADDAWAPEKLALHVAHLNSRPDVGVSYCPSLFIDDEGNDLGIGQYPKLTEVNSKTVFCRNPVGNGSAAVIRRQLLHKMNVNAPGSGRMMVFDEALRQSEDIELWTRIALGSRWRFEGIATPLTFYRVNNAGLSADVTKQLDSWQRAMRKNWALNPAFFKRYYALAKAYQLRYLARRAVHSGDSLMAIKLIIKAVFCNPRMVFEEPTRTGITFGCALLSLLPHGVYRQIEGSAMKLVGYLQLKKAGA